MFSMTRITAPIASLVAASMDQRGITNDRFHFTARPVGTSVLGLIGGPARSNPTQLTYEATLGGRRAGFLVAHEDDWMFVATNGDAPATNRTLPDILSALGAACENNSEPGADILAAITAWNAECDQAVDIFETLDA